MTSSMHDLCCFTRMTSSSYLCCFTRMTSSMQKAMRKQLSIHQNTLAGPTTSFPPVVVWSTSIPRTNRFSTMRPPKNVSFLLDSEATLEREYNTQWYVEPGQPRKKSSSPTPRCSKGVCVPGWNPPHKKRGLGEEDFYYIAARDACMMLAQMHDAWGCGTDTQHTASMRAPRRPPPYRWIILSFAS